VEPKETQRTVIIYLEANNNLYSSACENIDSLLANATEKEIGTNNELLIFLNGSTPRLPRLLRVVPGSGAKQWFVADTVLLKSYAKGNTLTTSFMKQVLSDAQELAPAKEYGLVLWSHGQGWLPIEALTKTKSSGDNLLRSAKTGKLTKWFGIDNSYHSLDIQDLRSALENFKWEYILMDACFGASVEALYELRNCCHYWAGSPTEIMQDGYPYGSIISDLFEKDVKTGVLNVCIAYMDRYFKDPDYPSASMCMVDMSTLDDLAESAAGMVSLFLPGKLQKPDFNSIQHLDNGLPPVFYDLEGYFSDAVGLNDIEKFSESRRDSILTAYEDFSDQLSKTIIYTAHTQKFYSCFDSYSSWQWIPFTHPVCGLSSYIPRTDSSRERYTIYNREWYQTSWTKAIGITKP